MIAALFIFLLLKMEHYLPSTLVGPRVESKEQLTRELEILEQNFHTYDRENGWPTEHLPWFRLEDHIKKIKALPYPNNNAGFFAARDQRLHIFDTEHAMAAQIVNDLFSDAPKNPVFTHTIPRDDNGLTGTPLAVPGVLRRDRNMQNRQFGRLDHFDAILRGTATSPGMVDPSKINYNVRSKYGGFYENKFRQHFVSEVRNTPYYGYLMLHDRSGQTMHAGTIYGRAPEAFFSIHNRGYPGFFNVGPANVDLEAQTDVDVNYRKEQKVPHKVRNFLMRSDFLHTEVPLYDRRPQYKHEYFHAQHVNVNWDPEYRARTVLSEPPTIEEVLAAYPRYHPDQHKIAAENELYTRRLATLYESLEYANLPENYYYPRDRKKTRVYFKEDAQPSDEQREIVQEINDIYGMIEWRNVGHHGNIMEGELGEERSDLVRYHPFTGLHKLWGK